LISNTVAFTVFINSIFFNIETVSCCFYSLRCLKIISPFCQIISEWLAFYPIFPLYLAYFDFTKETIWELRSAKNVFIVILCANLTLCIIAISLIVKLGYKAPMALNYAYFLGTIATGLSFLYNIPQLYKTFKIKDKGSLSIPGLTIAGWGSLGVTLYLAANKQHASTWMPQLVTAIQLISLQLLCMYYEYQKSVV